MNNSSPRLETQDSKHISQTFSSSSWEQITVFMSLSPLQLLFQSFNCTNRVSKEAATEHNWLHRRSQRQFLPLLLSPPCDSRATEAISWVKQSPQPSLSMTCEKSMTAASTTHTWSWWDITGGSGRIHRQAVREWDLWTGEELFLGMGGVRL